MQQIQPSSRSLWCPYGTISVVLWADLVACSDPGIGHRLFTTLWIGPMMWPQWQPREDHFRSGIPLASAVGSGQEETHPMRFSYVRSIHLDMVLDDYSKQTKRYVGNEKKKAQNNDVFTPTVAGLFSLLKPLDVLESVRGPRTLRLIVHMPSDELLLEEIHKLRYDGCSIMESECLMSHRSHICTLEAADWYLSDNNEEEDIRLQRRLRHDCSKSLQLLPLSLEHLILIYLRKPPKNYLFNLNDKLLETYGPDPLSTAPRNLPQRLVTVDLAGPIYPTNDCFYSSSFSGAEEPEWRRLETLSLDTSAEFPKGHWLFDRHAEYKPLWSLEAETGTNSTQLWLRMCMETSFEGRRMHH
ncbi:hypothetical protein SCARD494_10709 [Seiridium cardinale]